MSVKRFAAERAIFGVYFQEGLAYRASALIWILTDLTTAATMPLVWSAAAGNRAIAGFRGGDFVLYYLCYLLVQSLVTTHIMWEISGEIQSGQFGVALLRPMGYLRFTFFRSLAWRVFRTTLFFPIFLLLLFLYRGHLAGTHLELGPQFWVSLALGHFVSFCFVTAMSMLALLVTEAQAIFGLYYIPMLFLSGNLFPVALLPSWAKMFVYAFPFYFTAGLPTEIMVGRVSGPTGWNLIAGQFIWIVVSLLVGRWLYTFGLKRYASSGN